MKLIFDQISNLLACKTDGLFSSLSCVILFSQMLKTGPSVETERAAPGCHAYLVWSSAVDFQATIHSVGDRRWIFQR
jgi:hypothetical protein